MPLLIKICGVTTADDAAMAVEAGARAPSASICGRDRSATSGRRPPGPCWPPCRPGVLKVGVFVNAPAAEIARAFDELGLDRAQLHGDEQAADYAALDAGRLVKAVRVRDEASIAAAGAWSPALWLYDAFVDGFGGGGVAAPWPVIARAARRPFLLAGGLTPDNVAAGIRATHPDGVDVASGVERRPGVKDPAKVAAFVAAARAAI